MKVERALRKAGGAVPTPRRALAQVRSRLNHYYLVPWLETPYTDGSGDGQSQDGANDAEE